MKKFDMLTPAGLLFGIAMIIFGILSTGGLSGFLSFIDPSSVLIVIGGVFSGLLINFPVKEIKQMFIVLRQAFSHHDPSLSRLLETFVSLAEKARREGILSLEVKIREIDDPFLKKGMLLVIDGLESELIEDILHADIAAMEERHRKGRSILEKAGEYAPAWGMIGTLIGLVLMLRNLNDPASLGPNMAVAILTTFYGSLMANLIFLPLAAKLQLKTDEEIFYKQIIIEGVLGVQSGQNPRILGEKLSAFLSDDERLEVSKLREREVLRDEV
ncbi:flagellar motor protein MotP [Bacillaceae bacterium Marseille-Q3522]|nr:flagellar motor protein MotP [Bacillaceae bacterium Marseille-Q3522]